MQLTFLTPILSVEFYARVSCSLYVKRIMIYDSVMYAVWTPKKAHSNTSSVLWLILIPRLSTDN